MNADDKKAPKVMPVGATKKTKVSPGMPSSDRTQYNFLKGYSATSHLASNLLDEEGPPTAASEKELGNEYFKQKNFHKAIDCYSRSIGLTPTSVAFANRAMAYLKLKRYEEAEKDCTEALDLDDRYIKAYLRRATARKELGKLRESLEDSEFAMTLEPNNQELKKLHKETKALYEKEILRKMSSSSKDSCQGVEIVEVAGRKAMNEKLVSSTNLGCGSGGETVGHLSSQEIMRKISSSSKDPCQGVEIVEVAERKAMNEKLVSSTNDKCGSKGETVGHLSSQNKKGNGHGKVEMEASVQELAARAVSRVMSCASKEIKAPKSAYEFEVSWKSLSADPPLQARLLKSIPPSSLADVFKSALTSALLVDMIKRVASFFQEETEVALSILDNLTKVPRFGMVVMCFSPLDRADVSRLWDTMLSSGNLAWEQRDALEKMRPKFCPTRR